MKRFILLVVVLCSVVGTYAQNADSVKVTPKPQPLTQIQHDSILMSIESNVESLAKEAAD